MPVIPKHYTSKALLASALALTLASPLAQAAGPEAKHIILLIGDGMNIEHEIAASRYLHGSYFGQSFHRLPYKGNVATWDVSTYMYWSGGVYDPNTIMPTPGYDPANRGPGPLLPPQSGITLKACSHAVFRHQETSPCG